MTLVAGQAIEPEARKVHEGARKVERRCGAVDTGAIHARIDLDHDPSVLPARTAARDNVIAFLC